MNPALDIGQVEGEKEKQRRKRRWKSLTFLTGAFMMGIGYHTSENTQYNTDGSMISDGTWEYKVPSHKVT